MAKNVHEIAQQIMEATSLPSLMGFGLCNLVGRHGLPAGYSEFDWYAAKACGYFLPVGAAYLPNRGVWTEQRLNAIALLACTTPEDFEPDSVSEVNMLVNAGMKPEQAALAVQARIESSRCYGPWDPSRSSAGGWLLSAFSWAEHDSGRSSDNDKGWSATHYEVVEIGGW